ncbi:glycoside hydrolase family 76 protein [Hyaloscypha variabilis F]|uniref:Glycoside hydrolase family 76 protein n=1 Tax=Hyaloscypha variabilis (strain UAMH 11265 / GT02V1 / F) TaxID=1149755 RepID=A0A2J6RII2_HYAVF|nr:glycoside hydrolase family 76 protein [Hyaloscypha variabilis F]
MLVTTRHHQIGFALLWLWGTFFAIGSSGYVLDQEEIQKPLFADEQKPLPSKPDTGTLPALLDALDVLQVDYFAIWQGIWPTSIDWTSAVIGTYLSAGLSTLSTSFPKFTSSKNAENVVNKYFSQLSASYFGQDAFALRQEAYDDMLWVVLGWLESIKFIRLHSEEHYAEAEKAGSWYGEEWIPAFAHRARIFWELASQGWDTELCDGGMIWSPYLIPYKNAITNELYIAASISMYLYFPGDDNSSPFEFSSPNFAIADDSGRARDPKYLAAAIEAYRWLLDSNMTDAKGLFVDGYHISGWSRERAGKNQTENTRCDARNEMVYTYNQGVLLSGQRGLYEATGARSYLEDGHQLVSDVIAATGWDLKRGDSFDILDEPKWSGSKLGKWYGLGRSGILEEACDAPGYCSQDSQTFKGIFFHHLTLFCARLPDHLVLDGVFVGKDVGTGDPDNIEEVRKWHDEQCARYGSWIKHNAKAALATVNTEGRFGMWWGAPPHTSSVPDADVNLPAEAVDYRNHGVPQQWKNKERYPRDMQDRSDDIAGNSAGFGTRDLNDRGRGRTVETQGGGISVLRALWEIVDTRR